MASPTGVACPVGTASQATPAEKNQRITINRSTMAASSTTYPAQAFIEVGTQFKQIAMGSNSQVWALGTDNTIYKRIMQPSGAWKWQSMPGLGPGATAQSIACAADGTTLATDQNNKVYLYTRLAFPPKPNSAPTNWAPLTGIEWESVAAGSWHTKVGIKYDKTTQYGSPQLYADNDLFVTFNLGDAGLKYIDAASDNTIMGLRVATPDSAAAVYRYRPAEIAAPTCITPPSIVPKALGVGSANQVLVSDKDNNIYRYLGEQAFEAMFACEQKMVDGKLQNVPLNGTICNIACCGIPFYFVITQQGDTYTTYAALTD